MMTDEFARQLLALPLAERVALAEALWESIDGHSAGVMEEEQDAVELAKKRDAELAGDAGLGRTPEQVMEAARRALG